MSQETKTIFHAGVTETEADITLRVSRRHKGVGTLVLTAVVGKPKPTHTIWFLYDLADCINGLLPERAADRLVVVRQRTWGAAVWPRVCFWLSVLQVGALLGWWKL